MSLQEYQQQGAGFDISDFWYLQTCYKFLNESGTVLQTTSGVPRQMLKGTEPEKHQFFQRIALVL